MVGILILLHSALEQTLACIASISVQKAFSAFWQRANWTKRKEIDGQVLCLFFCSHSNFCTARMPKKLVMQKYVLNRPAHFSNLLAVY